VIRIVKIKMDVLLIMHSVLGMEPQKVMKNLVIATLERDKRALTYSVITHVLMVLNAYGSTNTVNGMEKQSCQM